ncbi:MAG: hypothetical protein IPH75_04185 [bacterium]|nr:hypothetical protein [bacterium]
MQYLKIGFIVLLALTLLAACTPGPNTVEDIPSGNGKTAGFLIGIWHGMISPITFVLSLFMDSINVYEVHNNGNWYNFGFVLGAGLFLTGGILGRKKSER